MFDFEQEKEKLMVADDIINEVVSKYDEILNNLSNKEKNTMQLYYYFKKLDTFKEMTPKGNYWNDKREESINKVTEVIKKLGNITFSSVNDLDELRSIVNDNMNGKLLDIINGFSLELKDAYRNNCDSVYTVLPISGLKELEESKHRENHYLTSIDDGVFATTSFSNIEKYIARANAGGLIAHGNQLEYPSNPFSKIEEEKMILIKPVSIYLGNVDLFEPQFDFVVDNHGFSHFVFDGEWIAPYEKIECVEEQVDYLPISFIEENDVYYYEDNERIQINREMLSDEKVR